jgi:HemK-related putative methylase
MEQSAQRRHGRFVCLLTGAPSVAQQLSSLPEVRCRAAALWTAYARKSLVKSASRQPPWRGARRSWDAYSRGHDVTIITLETIAYVANLTELGKCCDATLIARGSWARTSHHIVQVKRMLEVRKREILRASVLGKLGLSALVPTSPINISASHNAHVVEQSIPARFVIDGLTIEAPAGVYHPTPNSSSELFLRNLKAMDRSKIGKVLEIGAGCGAISLSIAAHWNAKVVASDISPVAIETIEKNAAVNGLKIETINSDLFEKIKEKDFDLIIFNAPLIDKEPENNVERDSLCDPGGHIMRRYLEEAGQFLKKGGIAIVSICSNSAYEALDDIDVNLRVIAFELSYSGFWWGIVAAKN